MKMHMWGNLLWRKVVHIGRHILKRRTWGKLLWQKVVSGIAHIGKRPEDATTARHGMDGLLQLPEELQWAIMGSLDVRGILTARLVCKQLLQSATAHLKGLSMGCTELHGARRTNFAQFSGLSRVTVSVSRPDRLRLLANHRIAPLITHVDLSSATDFEGPASPGRDRRQVLAPLMRLPNLRSLALAAQLDVVQLLPLTLEELQMRRFGLEDASPLTRLSRLTSLEIYLPEGAAPSLASLAGLRSLRSLNLSCYFNPSDVLSTFETLTSLTLRMSGSGGSGAVFPAIAPLTGLQELTLAGVQDVTHGELASLSRLTKLTRLDLSSCNFNDCVRDSSALAPLTGLACLRLGPDVGVVGESLLPHVNLGGLQSLALDQVTGDLSALRQATGLTELAFDCDPRWGQYVHELGPTLALMPKLCSLYLSLRDLVDWPAIPEVSPLRRILPALTGLTHLGYAGEFTVGDDMQACASLPHLCSLALEVPYQVAMACVPTLQGMSGLTKLDLSFSNVRERDLTPEVRAAFDVERLHRGWRRLDICYRRFW